MPPEDARPDVEQTIDGVAEYLAQKIASGEFAHGDQLPSRMSLAEQFNLSPAAVGIAMKRVAKMHPLEFIPGKGVFLSRRRSNPDVLSVALIGSTASRAVTDENGVSAHGEDSGSQELASLVAAARRRRWDVVVPPESGAEPFDMDRLISHGVKCLVHLYSPLPGQEVLEQAARHDMPVIFLSQADGQLDGWAVSYVYFDVRGAVRFAVRTLAERGHQPIAYVFSKPNDEAKWTAWRDAYYAESASQNLQYAYSSYCRVIPRTTAGETWDDLRRRIRRETEALLNLPVPPSAIYFSFYPFLLTEALSLLAERGLRPGRDIGVLCKTGSGDLTPTSLSSVVQRFDVLAERVMDVAAQLVQEPRRTVQVDVPHDFVDRGSIGDRGRSGAEGR